MILQAIERYFERLFLGGGERSEVEQALAALRQVSCSEDDHLRYVRMAAQLAVAAAPAEVVDLALMMHARRTVTEEELADVGVTLRRPEDYQ